MNKQLLGILACPICKGGLDYRREAAELVCYADGLAFPVRDDIPVLLDSEARQLTAEEKQRHEHKTS